MNWLDILLLCLAGLGLVKGLFDGVIRQVVSLIALVAAIFCCAQVADWLRGYILQLDWLPEYGVTVLSYLLGFMLIIGVLKLVGDAMSKLIGVTPLSILNHLLGGLFGLMFMMFFLSLTLNVMEYIDRGSLLIPREAKVESKFYYSIKEIVPTIFPTNLFSKMQVDKWTKERVDKTIIP